MKQVDSLAPSPAGDPIRHLALGFFDGLHLGHRRVILGENFPHPPAATAVLTFRDHPLSVLHPDKHPALITGLPHKLRVLSRWGIGLTIALPFNRDRSLQEPSDFLQEIAASWPALETVSVGPNWRFGRNRSGDVALLSTWCEKHGATLDNPMPVLYQKERISSSRIRAAIREGKLIEASAMLGRPFTILGQVVPGEGRGHGLGFPTANLATEDECLPPDGVYAGRACLADGTFQPAAINLGTGPTFERHQRKIEAHLPGFTGNLSGQEMDLEFHHWIRGEQKFSSPTALADQIRLDVATVLQSV